MFCIHLITTHKFFQILNVSEFCLSSIPIVLNLRKVLFPRQLSQIDSFFYYLCHTLISTELVVLQGVLKKDFEQLNLNSDWIGCFTGSVQRHDLDKLKLNFEWIGCFPGSVQA